MDGWMDGLSDGWIERLVGISIENEWKKTGTCAKIEKISVTNQMKTCSGWMDGWIDGLSVWSVKALKMNGRKQEHGRKLKKYPIK